MGTTRYFSSELNFHVISTNFKKKSIFYLFRHSWPCGKVVGALGRRILAVLIGCMGSMNSFAVRARALMFHAV